VIDRILALAGAVVIGCAVPGAIAYARYLARRNPPPDPPERGRQAAEHLQRRLDDEQP
jgi:hypothetical protein